METNCESNNWSGLLASFLIGGLVGAGIGLLLAPRSGVETRGKIKELAEDASAKAESLTRQVGETAQSALEKGKKLLEEKKVIIESAVGAGKEAYRKEKEKLAGVQ